MADGRPEKDQRKAASARRREMAFGLRMALTLIVTLSAIGAAQYLLTGPQLVERALDQQLDKYESDAVGMQEIYATHFVQGWASDFLPAPLREVLTHMAYSPDVLLVRVITPDASVAGVATSPGFDGTYVTDSGRVREIEGLVYGHQLNEAHVALVDHVFQTGGSSLELAPLDGLGDLVYHVPMRLGEFAFVLEVVTNDQLIRNEQHNLSRLVVTMLVVGIPLGIPIFYFLGGRGLHRRHATAVRHSSRDGLTGLGNHRAFQEQARREVDAAVRHGHPLALALIDLDHFKVINDNSGHRVGDEVLADVGRILGSGRPEDQAFRIGGDEFALILPFTQLHGARSAADRIREQVERANRGVTLSIGLAELDEGANVDSLREQADVALYEAKRTGRNRVVAFAEVDDDLTAAAASNGSAVHRLLAAGEMGVAFQPIWDLGAQAPLGFEALARPPEDSGLQGPLEMFDAADRIGRVAEVDELCRQAILDRVDDLPSEALLFINVAPATLGHELTAAERLAALVADTGLEPARVVLELTERTVARQSVVAREVSHLRAMGFKIALDDVGAGNSGLELLRHVPVDFIKIDRSVVVAALEDTSARAVLLAIVTFANETGTYVIAEGIEDGEQLSFVREMPDRPNQAVQQIRGAQGYLLGRPGSLTDPLPSVVAET